MMKWGSPSTESTSEKELAPKASHCSRGLPLPPGPWGDGLLDKRRCWVLGLEAHRRRSQGTHHSSRVLEDSGSWLWTQRKRGLS